MPVLPAIAHSFQMCNSRKIPVISQIPRPVVLATFVVFLTTSNLSNAAGAEHHLTILHTNDLLGRLLPEPYLGQSDWGGFARLAHVIDQERGARRDSFLVLDGGDALGDTPISALDAGRTVVELMNQMKYDAMVVGNHEFDYGLDSLYARRIEAKFDLLGANVRVESDRPPLTKPFVLKKRAGLSVAVIGVLSLGCGEAGQPAAESGTGYSRPGTPRYRRCWTGQPDIADLRVVLVHMSAGEARGLALAFPEVELWIAGSYARVTPAGAFEHAVRIDGRRIRLSPHRAAASNWDVSIFAFGGKERTLSCWTSGPHWCGSVPMCRRTATRRWLSTGSERPCDAPWSRPSATSADPSPTRRNGWPI